MRGASCRRVTISCLPRGVSKLHTDAADAAPPDAFGPFRVLHQIGAGALGPVYRAYQPELDRLVAVKVFRLDVPPERVHQFVAELEQLIAADLTHPGIAAPLAAGIAGTAAYLAQDFVAADSLDIVVRDYGPAPVPDAVRVAAQVAGALDFAAVVNVAHGALHPRDVLVSPDDTRLTGIGITRALERVGVTAAVRRPYTAPERAAGTAWDRRADVFSLAAVVYELLYGRRITGAGEQAAEVTELAGANVRQLRAVFARALAEDPAERFDTALEFAEQLRGSFSDAAITAVPRVAATIDTEPRLPLEASEPAILEEAEGQPFVAPPQVFQPESPLSETPTAAPTVGALPIQEPASIADLDLRQAEAARYEDVESAPSVPEPVIAATAAAEPPILRDADYRPRHAEPAYAGGVLETSRSALWPLALALILGAAIGAAMAVVLLNRDRPVTENAAIQTESAAAPTPPSAREFTEGQVATAPKPAEAPTARPEPSAPAPPQTRAETPPSAVPPSRGEPSRPEPSRPERSRGTAAPAATNTGRILVRSTPSGARVVVDGKEAGVTPLTSIRPF